MDNISYLTANIARPGEAGALDDPLHSRLMRLLGECKQAKASPTQWEGIINGLTQKGVKPAEIEDSAIKLFLKVKGPNEKIEKSELLDQIARRLPRIKCVDLSSPKYPNYKNMTCGQYKERLYILSSEAMVGDDLLEDLMYRLEDLGFNPAPLIADPDLVDRLEAEMAHIKSVRPDMYDFAQHHYSTSMKDHGKNLLAHARYSVVDDLLFIEEIQSDWAQKGRKNDWSQGFPKAPLVTNTEQWSGVVLRDLLHQAALSPECKRVAWINSKMRNGFNTNENSAEYDNLAVFYNTIVKKMVEKCIDKAGGRVCFSDVDTKNGVRSVMGFEMTDAVRIALAQSLPLYSREALLPRSTVLPDSERNSERTAVVQECQMMLGSAYTLRFVAKLYDDSFTQEVAGKYVEKAITLSLRARHLDRAARHEAWHFAEENFLLPHEKREMRLAFSVGSDLNDRTRQTLLALGAHEAARQCMDEHECAAHAFSLWCEGRLDPTPKADTIFKQVLLALSSLADWLENKVFGVRVQTPEDLFKAMRSGTLAARARMEQQDEQRSQTQAPAP